MTEDQFQLVVVDSPGLIRLEHAKNKIGTRPDDTIVVDPDKAVEKAEHILVVFVIKKCIVFYGAILGLYLPAAIYSA